MAQPFIDHPWLIVCALTAAVIVACVAIMAVNEYLKSKIDATLKLEMLAQGMSAADIKTVLEASSDGEATRLALAGNQGVRVGLGSFQVEVGSVNQASPEAAAAAGRG
jgi:hypothetical protein